MQLAMLQNQARPCACRALPEQQAGPQQAASRPADRPLASKRELVSAAVALSLAGLTPCSPAHALPGFQKDLTSKRKRKVPESEFRPGPDGLKYYDVSLGKGAEAKEGSRVAVHFDAKWKGITFQTSRMGMGVTGGTPLGFDVGAKAAGSTLPGLDLGVRGMRQGGQRKLLVPPNLAYGNKGSGEIPAGATLEFDVELLSVKTSAVGFQTKLIEG